MDFSTNVPMLNQLHSNITWGQRGNFVSIPTDTPARDERLGWTGDINVFAPTAAYNMESARFLTKWLVRPARRSVGRRRVHRRGSHCRHGRQGRGGLGRRRA